MGVAFGILKWVGLPSVDSLVTDKLYPRFSEAKDFNEFHATFLEVCSEFNKIMPGKHCYLEAGKREDIKDFFNKWKDVRDDDTKKQQLIEFMKPKVKDYKPDPTLMIATGCVVPAATIMLKKSGEKFPQVKKLRIDLVPDFVVVPGVTFVSLIGIRLLGLSMATSKIAKK